VKQWRDELEQIWDVSDDHLPYLTEINIVVFMCDMVAHTGHDPPRNFRMRCTKGVRQSLNRLAKDGNLVEDGFLRLDVAVKVGTAHATRELENQLGRAFDV
jgi:hypothetical protein